ncbi:MAG: cation diffusion facilitator family transporter [Candidatus Bipolaricaulota bacterium]
MNRRVSPDNDRRTAPGTSTGQPRALGRAVGAGLIANVVLAVLKTGIGIAGHSQALLADGINSTSDVIYYAVVGAFMRAARRPPDEEHPYGHRQLESIAALVVGAFVITTGVAIFWDSIDATFDLLSGAASVRPVAWISLCVALATVAAKIVLYFYTARVGRKTKNAAIAALAADHRNDILSASAAATGIVLGRLGIAWVDPLAGALVALFVLHTGVEIVRNTAAELMDTSLEGSARTEIETVTRTIDGVRGIDEIRAHRFGPYLVLNLTIVVDGAMSVAEGDAVASRVEEALLREIRLVRDVHVHYHPRTSGDGGGG